MKIYHLIFKSLWFYRRTSLMVLAGMALSAAILTGALIVGDSVRFTLKRMALLRLGDTHTLLQMADRYVPSDLADSLHQHLNVPVAPVLFRQGTALHPESQRRVNRIQVIGADVRFWETGNADNVFEFTPDNAVVLNTHLAERLSVRPGDELVFRFEKANTFPLGISFTSTSDQFFSRRLTIDKIIDDDQFGRFGLEPTQIAPNTVFLPLKTLGEYIDAERQCNLILIGSDKTGKTPDKTRLYEALSEVFRIDYAQLALVSGQNGFDLKSERIFINQSVLNALQSSDMAVNPVLTYFADQIRRHDRFTPYSFVTGMDAGWYPPDMTLHDIVLNTWIANDLNASVGDSVTLHYEVLNHRKLLQTDSSRFCVKKIIPVRYKNVNAALTPDLPGLTEAQNCSDWDFGADIELDLIRPKDEAYWDEYGSTPKAFITYEAARQLWENVYGNCTSIRIQADNISHQTLEKKLSSLIEPAGLGFYFRPVRRQAIEASQSGVDFGELFLGLSFFVMAAAFLLTAILFHFSLDQRKHEIKTDYHLGLPRTMIYRQILSEGIILIVLGSVAGLIAGLFYNQVILWGLSSVWQGSVGTSEFEIHIKPFTLLTGFISHFIIVLFILWMGLNRHLKKLYFDQTMQSQLKRAGTAIRIQKVVFTVSVVFILSVALIFIFIPLNPNKVSGMFFLTGILLLAGFIGLLASFIMNQKQTFIGKRYQMLAFAMHAWQLHRWRHLLTIGLLSLSVFTLIGVGVNRKTASYSDQHTSGTGGYEFYAESSLPLVRNLNDFTLQKQLGFIEAGLDSVEFLLCRSAHGGDASCLNLNQIDNPRILSVDPDQLNAKGAFQFVRLQEGLPSENPWLHLNRSLDKDVIPAVADMGVMTWGMMKSIGDTLTYQNQSGDFVYLILTGAIENSVFQGNVLIAESHFESHFPNNEGYTVFLADMPRNQKQQFRQTIQQNLGDYGIDLQNTTQRLADFLTVENTYLSIFMALGGLGVLIGTIGMGILTARNIFERRAQLGLMKAVGFNYQQIRRLILYEQALLLIAGIIIGTVSGLTATWPMVSQSVSKTAYPFLAVMLLLILSNGLIWIVIAYRSALKGELIDALREE